MHNDKHSAGLVYSFLNLGGTKWFRGALCFLGLFLDEPIQESHLCMLEAFAVQDDFRD